MMFLWFALGFTLAVEKAEDRQVDVGKGSVNELPYSWEQIGHCRQRAAAQQIGRLIYINHIGTTECNRQGWKRCHLNGLFRSLGDGARGGARTSIAFPPIAR